MNSFFFSLDKKKKKKKKLRRKKLRKKETIMERKTKKWMIYNGIKRVWLKLLGDPILMQNDES